MHHCRDKSDRPGSDAHLAAQLEAEGALPAWDEAGKAPELPRPRPTAAAGVCRAYLHLAEDLLALLPHVGEGAALGEHQQAGQHLAQPVAGGGNREAVGGPGRRHRRHGSDGFATAENGLPDGVQGGGAGGSVAAAQPVPAHVAFPLLHGAGRLLPHRRLSSPDAAAPWRAPGSRQPAHKDDKRGGERRDRCLRRMGGRTGGRAGAPSAPGGRPRQPPPTDAGAAEPATPLGLLLSRRGAGRPPPRGAGGSSSPPQAWREGDGPGPASPPRCGPLSPPRRGRAGQGRYRPPTIPSPAGRGGAGTSPAQHGDGRAQQPIAFQHSLPAAQWRRGTAAPGEDLGMCSPAEGVAPAAAAANYVSRQAA